MMCKSASKVYMKELLLVMGAYVIAIIVLVTLININPNATWLRIPLFFIPIVPTLFTFVAYKRFFSDRKEV